MKKRNNMNLVLMLVVGAMSIVYCYTEPIGSWYTSIKLKDFRKKEFLAPEKCYPLVTPVCPCCDVNNPGKNCFVVTDDGDDENEPTLRAAIIAANASDATDRCPFAIVFNIPGTLSRRSCLQQTVCTAREGDVRTIFIISALPEIAKPVCINGFTQPGADEERRIITIQIDGNSENSDGLVLQPTAAGSTIKGLAIGNFEGSTLALIRVLASRSKISGNNIGILADGVTEFSESVNEAAGIVVDTGADIIVGGVNSQDKNVISSTGVGATINTPGVTFAGNFVGTDVTGTILISNIVAAINVNSDSNMIGCNSRFGRNIFAGLFAFDMNILGNNNHIINCFFGINVNGTQQLARSSIGIFLSGVSNTMIKNCLIGGYSTIPIAATECSSTTISHCFIGTDITGNTAIGGGASSTSGVLFDNSQNNEISSNLISYKDGVGIGILNASNTVIRNNFIGTNAAGTCPIAGCQDNGILLISGSCRGDSANTFLAFIESLKEVKNAKHTRDTVECCPIFFSPNDTIKNLIEYNLISGNRTAGIFLLGARLNTIAHNKIGTDALGKCSIPNGYGILFLGGAQSNTVECNLIAGNNLNGILASPRI